MAVVPSKYNMTISRGCSFSEVFTLGMDLTGYTVAAQAREQKSKNSTLVADFSVDVTPGAEESTVALSLTAAETATISQDRAEYDIILTPAASDPLPPYIEGAVIIKGTATDA